MKLTTPEKFGMFGAGLMVLLAIASAFGWVVNIVKLIALLDGGVTAWMIARAIGVFAAPLGAILGYF